MSTRKRNDHRTSAELLDQPPPHDLDAERDVLGSLLLAPELIAKVAATIQPSDFYSRAHADIYRVIQTLDAEGKKPDATLLLSSLNGSKDLKEIGGKAYIAELVHAVPTAANAEYYADIVRKKRLLRLAQLACFSALKETYSPGADGRAIIESLSQATRGIIGDREQFRLQGIPSAEFLADGDAERELVSNVLMEDHLAILGAPYKTLKTSIAFDLAISLAIGGCFLGYFHAAEPMRVGVIPGESSRSGTREVVHRIASAAKIDPLTDLQNLVWETRLPTLGDPQHMQELVRFVRDNGLTAVFLDPAMLMMPGGADKGANLFGMAAEIRPLKEELAEVACTPVLLHHFHRRAATTDPPQLADLFHAGFAEIAGQWLLLSRQQKYDAAKPGEHSLWMQTGGRSGHGGLYAVDVDEGQRSDPGGRTWDVSVRPAAEFQNARESDQTDKRRRQESERLEEDLERLMGAVDAHPDGATKSRLRDWSTLNSARIGVALAEAEKRGLIAQCEVTTGNHKRPKEGYRRCAG